VTKELCKFDFNFLP